MPLFSFICEECGQHFETWVRSSSAVDEVTCPACESAKVARQLSRVAGLVGGKSGSLSLAASAGSTCSIGGG